MLNCNKLSNDLLIHKTSKDPKIKFLKKNKIKNTTERTQSDL